MGKNGRNEAGSKAAIGVQGAIRGSQVSLRAQCPSRSRNPRQQQAMQENQRRPLRRLAAGWPYFALSSLSLYFRVKKAAPLRAYFFPFFFPLPPAALTAERLALGGRRSEKSQSTYSRTLNSLGDHSPEPPSWSPPPTLKCVLSDE